MHRGGVPSHVTTQKVNFYRISEIVINVFTQILRDILLFYYQRPKDLQQKIKDVHLEHKLKKNISTIMDGDGYEKCDISILYTLLRNTCQIIPPTITERRRWGWGGDVMPSRDCITLGDDIERIRIMRNRICTHVYNTEMEDGKFEKYYEISLGVCKRLTGKFGTKDYVKELESLKTCRMEADSSLNALTEKLIQMIESNESLRDFVRKYTRIVSSEINELRHVVKQLRDEKATSEDFFKRNQKGDIQSMTVNALDLIRRMQTEPGNTDVRDRSRQIIDAVISDTCKRGGINLQVLETRFSEIFESSFKRTVGFKLLDYLTKHPDKFTMYKHAANQWTVVLAGHDLPVHAKRRKKSKQKTASKRNTQVEDFDVSIFYKDQTEKVKMDEIQDVEPDISPRDDSDNIEIFHSTESLSYSSEGWDEDYDDGNNEDHQYNDDDVAYHQNKEGEKMVEAKISDPNALKSIELSKDVFSKTFPKKHESVNTEISSMSYPKSKIQAREYTIEKKKIRHPESQGYGTSSSLKTKSKPKKLSLLPTSDSNIVTQIKLKYCKGDRYDIFSLDETTPSKEIIEIFNYWEDNFKDLETGNIGYSVGLIESDYKDWMNAIRLNQYDRKVRLEEVYRKLQLWHDRARTPISKFYVFIVCATMTILNKDVNHFFEAKEMLEEVKKYKHHFPRANKPREWLGNCSGVKCLIPSCFVKQKPDSGVDEVEFSLQTELKPKFLKGSILGSNQRPHSGTISLSVCNGSQFEVFFAPVRTKEKLVGTMYANQRVEFILAFTVSNGFMAYNVKRIETIPCGQCSRKVEFVTDQYTAECRCGHLVQKLEERDIFLPDFS